MGKHHVRKQQESMDIYIANAAVGAISKMIDELKDIAACGQTKFVRNLASENLDKIAKLMRNREENNG
jgi:hypothetical protein